MLVYIEEHIWLLVYSLFLGASLGALYDVFRVTRIAFGCGVRSKISHSLYNKKLPLVGTLRKKNPIIPKRSTKADSTPKKKDKGKSKKQSKCSASVNVGSGTDSIDRIDSNSIDETGDSVSENRSENRENSGKDTVKGENKASPGSKSLLVYLRGFHICDGHYLLHPYNGYIRYFHLSHKSRACKMVYGSCLCPWVLHLL